MISLLDKLFPRPVTPEQYARLVVEELRRQGHISISTPTDPFELRLEDGSKVFLNNGYALYCKASNAERPSQVINFVQSLTQGSTPITRQTLNDLLPIVRNRIYYSMTELMHRADGSQTRPFPHKAFAPGLVTGLVVDSAKAMSFVNAEDCENLHLSFAEAHAIAIENLESGFDHTLVEHADGLYIGDWDDGYASSRILLPSIWKGLRLKGAPLIHIPCRDKFFVVGDSDLGGIELALTLGEEELNGAYPLAADLFAYREGRWRSATLGSSDAKSIQDRMIRNRLALDYSQQKELLDRIHEREQIDVFVASYLVRRVIHQSWPAFQSGAGVYRLCYP